MCLRFLLLFQILYSIIHLYKIKNHATYLETQLLKRYDSMNDAHRIDAANNGKRALTVVNSLLHCRGKELPSFAFDDGRSMVEKMGVAEFIQTAHKVDEALKKIKLGIRSETARLIGRRRFTLLK